MFAFPSFLIVLSKISIWCVIHANKSIEMDAYTRRKAIGGPGFSVRGGTLAFSEPNCEDRQNCSRFGCATRFSSTMASRMGRREKPKHSGSSFRSTCSKALAIGSSSRSLPSSLSKRTFIERQERSSLEELSHGGESSNNREIVNVQSSGESEFVHKSSGFSTVSSSRSCKPKNQSISRNQEISLSSSLKRPVTPGSGSSKATKPVEHNLRNRGCNFLSDVLPDRGNINRRVDSVRKRLYEGETSSSRAKSITASFTSGVSTSVSRRSSAATSSLSRSEGSLPTQASGRSKNQPVGREGAVSVRTRRSINGDTRTRSPEQTDDNILSVAEPIINLQSLQNEAVSESSLRSVPVDHLSVVRESTGRRSSGSRTRRNRSISRAEDHSSLLFHGPIGNGNGYRRLTIEGIAEVLLALERIEQDEELEQLLVLETNLVLGGRRFYDQHRDMRMDIDNMTYEELLALEEKMGTVSTALSEEALAKCLQRSIYMSEFSGSSHGNKEDDDTKCSICQEEYASGDEVGKLACEHPFHVACVHQWLRLKNWCPICKAPACTS